MRNGSWQRHAGAAMRDMTSAPPNGRPKEQLIGDDAQGVDVGTAVDRLGSIHRSGAM